MSQLLYTALTARGQAYDIHFPLHPETSSHDAVAGILTAVLAAVSNSLTSSDGRRVSDGDVLQALAMAVAVRARIVEAELAATSRLTHDLLDQSFAAVREAQAYTATRA